MMCPDCYGPCTCPPDPDPIDTLRTIPVAAEWVQPEYSPVEPVVACPYTHGMYPGWSCRLVDGHTDEHDLVDTGKWY